MVQKRYPMLLDPGFPPERRILDAIQGASKGDQARFARALIVLGHLELAKEQRQSMVKEKESSLGVNENGAATN